MPETKKFNDPIGIMDPNQYAFAECLDGLIRRLGYTIPYKGQTHTISTRRIKSRPYNVLGAGSSCKVILNRGAHWNPHFNSFFTMVAPTVYLINDMVSFRSIDKNCSYGQMHSLGIHIPATWAIPQKDNTEYEKGEKVTPELVFKYHEMFDLKEFTDHVGFPAYLKPQDGGGWIDVTRVENFDEFVAAYDKAGKKPMNLQKAVDYTEFVRTVGVGPTMMPMHYNASAKLSHDRYKRSDDKIIEHNFLTGEQHWEVRAITKTINAFYGWDHNSCESLIEKGSATIFPIDFANAYPDSSPISLHYYFPDLVKAMVRWLIFIAVTGRKKRVDFAYHWPQFFEIAARHNKGELSYKEALLAYEALADQHFDTAGFNAFCAEHMANLDEIAVDYFTGDEFQAILERDIAYYFKIPAERPEKLAHYWGIFKFWEHCERERLAAAKA